MASVSHTGADFVPTRDLNDSVLLLFELANWHY